MSSKGLKYAADTFSYTYGQFIKPRKKKYSVEASVTMCEAYKAYFDNVKWEPLVDTRKVLIPPIHIKLGLMKQFVTALDNRSAAFQYLRDFFPLLSEEKIEAGIFVGPQVKILECKDFPNKLSKVEKVTWDSLKAMVRGFLGNHKDENHVELIDNLIKNYGAMGCRMSLRIHMPHSHLDEFKDNMGAYSEEQRESFYQDIKDFERRYQGQYNVSMMGDYIWGLVRESNYYTITNREKMFDSRLL